MTVSVVCQVPVDRMGAERVQGTSLFMRGLNFSMTCFIESVIEMESEMFPTRREL